VVYLYVDLNISVYSTTLPDLLEMYYRTGQSNNNSRRRS